MPGTGRSRCVETFAAKHPELLFGGLRRGSCPIARAPTSPRVVCNVRPNSGVRSNAVGPQLAHSARAPEPNPLVQGDLGRISGVGGCINRKLPEVAERPSACSVEALSPEDVKIPVCVAPGGGELACTGNVGSGGNTVGTVVARSICCADRSADPGPLFGDRVKLPEVVETIDEDAEYYCVVTNNS